MSAWAQDDYVKSEFSLGGITLDDIMKDYYSAEPSEAESAPLGSSLSSFTGERTADLTDIASYLNSLYAGAGEAASAGDAPAVYEEAPAEAFVELPVAPAEEAAPAIVDEPTGQETAEPPKSTVSEMEAEARGIFAQLNADDYARLLAEEQAAAERDAQIEIDPRFNIGGKHRRHSMYYAGNEVDMSSDPDYVQADQGFDDAARYTGGNESDDGYYVEDKPSLFNLFKRKKRSVSPKLDEAEKIPAYAEEDLRYTRASRKRREEKLAPAEETVTPVEETVAPAEEVPEEVFTAQEPALEEFSYEPEYGYAEEEEPVENMAAVTPEEEEDPEFVSSFRDYADEDLYADDLDYEDTQNSDDSDFPGTFKEFISSEIAGLLLRLRGGFNGESTSTVEEEEEDLGPEVSAKAASQYYGSFIRSLRLRCRIAVVLVVIMAWISVGLPVPGMLKDVRVASAMLLACQLNIMLLALDVLTGSITNMTRLKFGADALVLLSCIVTCVDAILVARTTAVSLHIPLCVLSSLSLLGLLASSLLSAQSMRKAIRVPAIGKRIYAVTGEAGVKGGDVTLLKSVRSYKGFVRRCEEAPPDETFFIKASPFVVLISLFFALIIAVAKHHTSDFVYIFSAVLAPAVPFTALLSFALPYFVGSFRIFASGAAIAGWSGLCDIGTSRNLIVTDRDLFPEGSVELDNIRIFADESSEKVISYAGTMLTAAGSSVSSCFAEVMEHNHCTMRQVEDFEYLSGGGMQGIIDGDRVLCGSTDLMRLMNVRIPHRLVDKCSVLLAINGVLYGIFNMKYTGTPQVRYALTSLMRSNRHPIFAIRDFNVTPDMLSNTFDVATDGYDFPPYVERFAISDAAPSEDSKIAAVVCREGLAPLTHMADTGRSMYMAVRMNLAITAAGIALTLLTVFLKFLISGTIGAGFLLGIMVFWSIPVVAISMFMRS